MDAWSFCLPCSWNSRQWQILLLSMVCVHDKTLNQQCMLAQARPPMINHLTSSLWSATQVKCSSNRESNTSSICNKGKTQSYKFCTFKGDADTKDGRDSSTASVLLLSFCHCTKQFVHMCAREWRWLVCYSAIPVFFIMRFYSVPLVCWSGS